MTELQRSIVIALVAFTIAAVGTYFIITTSQMPRSEPPVAQEPVQPPQPIEDDYAPQRATLSGTYLCLPHVNTDGPQTLECAFGIKTDDGTYYALDFALMSQIPPNIPMNTRFTASGVLTPIERLSTDHWRIYPIKGIFSVTDSVEVD
jgi:hypothetical protein